MKSEIHTLAYKAFHDLSPTNLVNLMASVPVTGLPRVFLLLLETCQAHLIARAGSWLVPLPG